MIRASDTCSCNSQSKCKRATASPASSRNLSLPILSTFAAAAFAVVFLAGAFLAVPAQAQPSPGSFSTVYNFDFNPNASPTPLYDGANPDGNLVEDSSGDLFGVTQLGGAGECGYVDSNDTLVITGCGTIYELIPNTTGGGYTETVLHSFQATGDGALPVGGLTIDSAGDLFGTTVLEGSDISNGTIFEMPSDGGKYDLGLETIHSFRGCNTVDSTDSTQDYPSGCRVTDGAWPTGHLVVDSAGDVFGTTFYGGGSDDTANCGPNSTFQASGNYTCGTVYELTTDSGAGNVNGYSPSVTLLHSFANGTDSGFPQGGLVTDSSGNLFGTAGGYGDGDAGYGAIFELTEASNYSTFDVLYTFGSFASGPIAGLTVDGSGDLFGTTAFGGANGNGTIFELLSYKNYSQPPLTLYSFTSNSSNSSDGRLPLTSLVIDSSGDLYGTTAYDGTGGSDTTCDTSGCGAFFELPYSSGTNSYASSLTIIHEFAGGDDGANPALGGLLLDSSGNIFGTAMAGGNSDCQFTAALDPAFDDALPGCGAVFELPAAPAVALNFEYAKVRIIEGTSPSQSGFDLQADVTPTDTSTFDPLNQPVTLTVGTYSVTIPKGSFQPLTHGRFTGAWVYTGTIGGVTLSVQIDPLDTDGDYEFKANASGVQLPPDLTSINVFIQVGDNAGTTTVTPSY